MFVGVKSNHNTNEEITMAKTVHITCRYFYVKTYSENDDEQQKLFDLRSWIGMVADYTLPERIISLSGSSKGRLDSINVRENFYAMNFVRMEDYSSTYIVKEAENAKHVDISVDEDEYIGKNTVAIYDATKSVLMLMANQGGFSASTVTSYINSFYDKPVCVLEPVKLEKNFTKSTNKFGKIQIKISSVDDYSASKGAPYEDVLRNARDMSAQTMSFEFSVGKKKNAYLDANIVRTIISDAFSNMGAVSIARVKMEDEQGSALYNLFENVKNCILTLKTDSKGEIGYKVIAEAMVENYK
jgi:hypothetical protein